MVNFTSDYKAKQITQVSNQAGFTVLVDPQTPDKQTDRQAEGKARELMVESVWKTY